LKKELIGVIPAAGKGTRLFPYPGPKELFPIGYQEIEINGEKMKCPKVVSQYLIESFKNSGIYKVIIVLSDNKFDIMRYYGNGNKFKLNIVYTYQEVPTGMPDAIDIAYPWIKGCTVVFGMPDTIISPNNSLKHLLNFYNNSSVDVVLGCFKTDKPYKFGMVDFEPKTNIVKSIIDKPSKSNLEYMWGIGIWNDRFTEFLHNVLPKMRCKSTGKEIVLGDVFQCAINDGLIIKAYLFLEGRYSDIGTWDEIAEVLKRHLGV
jgi:glucose-1-phosphate thymidylyltransferase